MLHQVQQSQRGRPAPLEKYQSVRSLTEMLCEGLAEEEFGHQSECFVSPPKWHLAHTTWFYENFILVPHVPQYRLFNEQFPYLFNSYYRSQGEFHARSRRGMLGRPTVAEVLAYRAHVDGAMADLVAQGGATVLRLLELGLNHEQQHQELLLADTKYNLFHNPLRPAWKQGAPEEGICRPREMGWVDFPGGLRSVGAPPESGFQYDNETPQHLAFVNGFSLGSRLVTNGEYLEFVQSGGYDEPRWWLDDGWAEKQQQGWTAPLYWEWRDGQWFEFRLTGLAALAPWAPVCHISYYEADAFACWKGARLPTEQEWEWASEGVVSRGVFLEEACFHPRTLDETRSRGLDGEYEVGLHQLFGDVWEWTQSAYLPYPGYQRDPQAALGEYNGKFMVNQMVLRGGACVTPESHFRRTYRNFLHPQQRWLFSGLRLARSTQPQGEH